MRRNGRSRYVALIAAGALLATAGCNEESTEPVENLDGLAFSYSGALSGSYDGEGNVPAIGSNGRPEFGSWSVARPDSLGGLVIVGFDPTDTDVGDLFILQLDDIREGVWEPCGILAGGGCHGRFIVGVVLTELATAQDAFEMASGRVEITEATDTRIRGIFEATFTSGDGNRTISVTEGVIDVPFTDERSLANGLSCLARNLENGTNEPC
jgi:hypothetical protein